VEIVHCTRNVTHLSQTHLVGQEHTLALLEAVRVELGHGVLLVAVQAAGGIEESRLILGGGVGLA
jgi:hypothetical protein